MEPRFSGKKIEGKKRCLSCNTWHHHTPSPINIVAIVLGDAGISIGAISIVEPVD